MPKTKVKKRKHIFLLLRIAVVACGVIWVVSRIGQEQRWGSFVEYFRRMNIGVFAAALCIFTVGHLIIGLRWWLLLRSQSIFIGFWAAVRLYFLGWFYNNFMPSSMGGDIVRAWYVTKHTDKKFEAALSVFVDRAIGLLSTLIIAVSFYMIFLRGQGSITTSGDEEQRGFATSAAEYKWHLLWAALLITLVLCAFLLHRRGRVLLERGWSGLRLYGLKVIKKLMDAIVLYCRKPLVIFAVFGLTVCMQIMVITGFWFVGVNMGIDASVKYYYVFFTLTWVVGAIPVSIGGIVVIEGSLVVLFTHFAGTEESAAWAIAMLQRAVWMLTSLPGAVIHLFGAHLPKDFFVDYENVIN
jgi:uncharacterized membrane protein YbhN (UPF0104 family)